MHVGSHAVSEREHTGPTLASCQRRPGAEHTNYTKLRCCTLIFNKEQSHIYNTSVCRWPRLAKLCTNDLTSQGKGQLCTLYKMVCVRLSEALSKGLRSRVTFEI